MKLLAPLVPLFAAGLAARNKLYDSNIFHAHRLARPVISIGNLRVGGTGKTPFTITLGELLQQRKIPFDILSRGYGREGTGVALVDDKGSAREYGDEPLLMSRKLGVPVIVGGNRFAAGQHAEQLFQEMRPAHDGQWLHLLDDGFQHRSLARDYDIVLLTASDFNDRLLPVGRLREPLSALRRADAVVLPEGLSSDVLPQGPHSQQIWRVKRNLVLPGVIPERPIAVCGIARPQQFLDDLRRTGLAVVSEAIFPDHHRYTDSDVRMLLKLREKHAAGGFVTTEKDAINLEVALGTLLAELAPVIAIPLKMELIDPERALDTMLGTIAERLRCRAEE